MSDRIHSEGHYLQCPHCGYQDRAPDEVFGWASLDHYDSEVECGGCGRRYFATREVVLSYSSRAPRETEE